VFDKIARMRLQLDVLPNLGVLEWIMGCGGVLEMSVVFMHERVRRFVVWLPFDGGAGAAGAGAVGWDSHFPRSVNTHAKAKSREICV
jgi:hypothetical protein